MRVRVVVTDDAGRVHEGECDLVAAGSTRSRSRSGGPQAKPAAKLDPKTVDLNLPIRAFMNRYAKGAPGPQAFAILVARLAGDAGREVPMDEIKGQWTLMKGLIGTGFQSMFATRAKNNAWVDSPRRGVFVPLDWAAALGPSSR